MGLGFRVSFLGYAALAGYHGLWDVDSDVRSYSTPTHGDNIGVTAGG